MYLAEAKVGEINVFISNSPCWPQFLGNSFFCETDGQQNNVNEKGVEWGW